MLELLFETTRWIHIVCGGFALTSGLLALVLSRKTNLHRPLGKVFFYSMIVVFVTAVVLALRAGIEFLFCLAFLSFYSALRGVRALRFLKGAQVHRLDWVAAASVLMCGIYLVGRGSMAIFSGNMIAILYIFFGGLSMFLAFEGGKDLRKLKSGDPKWFRVHQGSMGGALIATITAFSATTLTFLPGLVQWLWPTVLLAPMLSYLIRSFNKSKKPSL